MKQAVLLLSILTVGACNTVRGVGEDVGLAGHTLAATSDEVAGKPSRTAQQRPAKPAPAAVNANDRNTIKEVQSKLRDERLYNGRIDGIAGRRTHKALADYQRQKNLSASGEINRATLDSLNGVAAEPNPAPANPAPEPNSPESNP